MDNGAHFHKSDFQVHTPRDLNWSGTQAVSDEERRAYADELVLACRAKNITAIAITDHHDFGFFPYIRQAAKDELDDTGAALPANKQLIVFPGLELTLTSPACQALLLLDADFPENLLPSVLTALSITPAPADAAKHAAVQRIPHNVVGDLSDLYEKLGSHQHLKGRFIVLPNVTETGHGTILRTGFANFYKTMPCVGGYTDGQFPAVGTGAHTIVTGKDRNYGFKAIGVFQTSDNRTRNHDVLGTHTTWVKWSEPTAEALRQACLAKESRMSNRDPELPSLWITEVNVSNSKFLGRVKLELNQQYSALIGGRGTGKSTILEYLRWGLCDQPVENYASDLPVTQGKRKKLIDETLQTYDGEVIVTFLLNGIRHIVKRSSKTQEILLKIESGEFVLVTEQEIRNLLPIQAYSQKQLSNVGVREEELKRFVELPVKKAIDQIRSDIRDTAAKIRIAYGNLVRKGEIESEVSKYDIEISSLKEQVERLRGGLKGLTEEDHVIIRQKAKYDGEEQVIETFKNDLQRISQLIDLLVIQVGEPKAEEVTDFQNPAVMDEIRQEYLLKFNEITSQLSALVRLMGEESREKLSTAINKWQDLKSAFEVKYEAAKSNATVNQQQLTQIGLAETRIAELNKLQTDNRNSIRSLGSPDEAYQELRQRWDELHGQKMSILNAQCSGFSSLSNGLIKAEITGSLNTDLVKKSLKTAFAGMNVREQKLDDICQVLLTSANPLSAWNGVLSELEQLALYKVGSEPLPPTPGLVACGFIDSERTRIATSLDSARWLDLSLLELEFGPVFSYCTNLATHEFIDFGVASAGQQATALLTVLLNQEGAPLIIDQPEDDVDSKAVTGIIEQIWKAKTRRQIIFASHNANFVVNGDAELVVCCDYIKAGDQTAGQIRCSGAIDNKTIRDEITSITEGGREAFKLRMDKYGF